MNENRNLYRYVYRMLLTAIYNGTYKNHDKLPSLVELSAMYNVGRNTLRSALGKLQEDGYVSLQKGAHARVSFDVEDLHTNLKYRQFLMDTKNMTKDVYDTMAAILPELFIHCFKEGNSDMQEIKVMLQNYNIQTIHNETELVQGMYEIYMHVFKTYENPIITDLFYTLLTYSYQPIVEESHTPESFKRSVNGIRKSAYLILKFANAKQETLSKNMVKLMVNLHASNSMRNIDRLCHDVKEENPSSFVWVCNRTSEYLYAEVIIAIMNDIIHKIYPVGKALPSIEQMALQYGVSQRTIRKSLDILRQYEIIETINGIGSLVKLEHFKSDTNIAQNPEVRQSLQLYKYALEAMRIIFKKVAVDILGNVDKQELIVLADQIKKQKSKTLEPLSTFIFQRCNPCLWTIYEELLKTLNWCVFANMLGTSDPQRFITLREHVTTALCSGKTSLILEASMQVLKEDERHICEVLKKDA